MKKPGLLLILTAFAALSASNSYSQYSGSYSTRKTYTSADREVIDSIKYRFTRQILSLPIQEDAYYMKRINSARFKIIEHLFKANMIIKDDTLENYINAIVKKIINTEMYGLQRKIYIVKSHQVNAWCYGAGIYFVTTGLLAHFENEDQLAFALAHELAHDQLNHIEKNILIEINTKSSKKSSTYLRTILFGNPDAEDIEAYRKLAYSIGNYSRQHEFEADSLGLMLFLSAGYPAHQAVTTIDVLQSRTSPKHNIGVNLIMPLHSEDYPFQDHWLNERLSLYSNGQTGNGFWQSDSLATHPAADLRKERLRASQLPGAPADKKIDLNSEFSKVSLIAEFETLESAYAQKYYDYAMYYALQLLHRHPSNNYLVSRIGQILFTLYSTPDKNVFDSYVPRFTTHYSEDLRIVNNILHNMTQRELGELTYHFLKGRLNEKIHYYLLWKICDLTYRNKERNKIKADFKKRFSQNISTFRCK